MEYSSPLSAFAIAVDSIMSNSSSPHPPLLPLTTAPRASEEVYFEAVPVPPLPSTEENADMEAPHDFDELTHFEIDENAATETMSSQDRH